MYKLRTILTWGLLLAAAHVKSYTITVSPIEIEAGQSTNLIINLNNTETNLTAYQMSLYLPEGVTVQKRANGKYAYTANPDRHDGEFTFSVKDAVDGSILIAVFSVDKDVLMGTDGELIRLPISVASTVTTSLQGSIKNIEFTDVNSQAHNHADVMFGISVSTPSPIITFADPAVKALCVANWDMNSDGELSEEEAAAVTDLGEVFRNRTITSFNELQYFTGLTSIGKRAFMDCTGLTSVTIPNNVASIGDNAFYNCKKLPSVTIPNSVTSIGSAAFYDCIRLTTITIPNGVTSISSFAFKNSGLTSVIIPNGVTNIGNDAFHGCTDLTTVTIPNSLTNINYQTFYGCTSLASISIPNGVTTIDISAFQGCSGLTSFTIPNSVTSIGDEAFYGCSALTSVTIPSNVTNIGDAVFSGCSGLTSINVEDGNTKYDSRDNCNAIVETESNTIIAGCQNTIIPSSVTSINRSAFSGCSGLTSVTIPGRVTSIGYMAFQKCSGLVSVTIPSSVITIGGLAFWNCSSLTSVVSEIEEPFAFGDDAFKSISNDCVLTIPSGTRDAYIAAGWTEDVFKGGVVEAAAPSPNIIFADANVKALCIANWDTNGDGELSEAEAIAVTDLGEVFKGNTTITSFNELQYFTGLIILGENAFRGCSNLASVILPEGLMTIEGSALRGTALTTLTIPASVTNIVVNGNGGIAEECTSLMNINVEEGNSRYYSLDGVVFTEDEELVGANGKGLVMFPQGRSGSYEIPNDVTIIGERAFVACTNLTSVTMPNSVTSIRDCAFYGCRSLKSIVIPDGVTSIGSSTFCGCSSLASISISNSVTNIGEWTFQDCTCLIDVFCGAVNVPTTGNSVFSGINTVLATLHVPAASLETYSNTAPWSDFGTIVPIGEEVNTETIEITSAADLANFASRVNAGETSLGAILKTDIDFTAYPYAIIGEGVLYRGEFDGAGHTITLAMQHPGEYASLFHDFAGHVHDLTITGTIATSSKYAGGIASVARNATIERCQSRVNIISSVNGDGTHGGIVGISFGNTIIRDCLVSGSITGDETTCCAGVSGWASGTTYISNCLIRSQFTVDISGSDLLARNSSNVISTNNYFQGEWNAANNCGNVTLLTENQVESGEACFLLNAGRMNDNMVWYQTLGRDDCPVPDNRHLPVLLVDGSYVNGNVANITFDDANVKALCVANWDTNGDGELSEAEAAAVTDLGEVFKSNRTIVSFNELQYFTGLTSIVNYAFYYCTSLTSITIPEGVTTIGNNSFYSCNNLTSITIPNSVTSIGNYAFYFCTSLTSITIPEGVTTIGNYSFYSCNNLTSITIPNSVTSIGNYAFNNCGSLTSITIPNSVTSIGSNAFSYCSGLNSIMVEEGNTYFDSRENCDAIIKTSTNQLILGCKNTIIPNSVTSIGSYAFSGCTGLSSIVIPENVTSIGNSVFSGCSGLNSIMVAEGNVYYNSRDNCNAIIETSSNTLIVGCKNTVILSSVTSIGSNAFFGCGSLTSIVVPESVTSIGSYAFSSCNGLTSIVIPNSVTSIGNNAFFLCTSLASVKVDIETPLSISSSTFSSRTKATLYVPAECKTAYQSANYWSEFKDIIGFVEGDVNSDNEVDVVDVVDIARYVVGTPAATFVKILADINRDGNVNVADAVVLVNEIAGDQNFVKGLYAPQVNNYDDYNYESCELQLLKNSVNGLSFCMNGEMDFTAFQFVMEVPEGIDVSSMRLNSNRKQGHQLIYNKMADGTYCVVALSVSNNTFDGDEGELLGISLYGVPSDDICIRDIHFVNTAGRDFTFDRLFPSNDTETGIETIDHSSSNNDHYYNLAGQRLSKMQKGINIVNGKKIAF